MTRLARIASTAYVKGFADAITFITVGTLSRGNNALDKKKSGITKKFVIAIKPCISFTTAPMPELKLTIVTASIAITNNVSPNMLQL